MLADRTFNISEDALADFCLRHRVRELALFGSVLRPDFGPDSDIDVLVTFAPDVVYSLRQLIEMQNELEQLFGRPVDLVDKQSVQESPNYIRRRAILDSAEIVYAR